MTIEHCQQIYKNQNRTSMFFPKSNLCAGSPNALDIDIVCNFSLYANFLTGFLFFLTDTKWCSAHLPLPNGSRRPLRSARNVILVDGDQSFAALICEYQQF